MIYYFLPSTGIYGGVKVGYQFVDALNASGQRAAVASPLGEAAQWLCSNAPVVDRDRVLANWSVDDVGLFSLPGDYEVLRGPIERLVYHCQGTDPAIDRLLADSRLRVLTSWSQAREYVERRGHNPFDVGFGIDEAFCYSGEVKVKDSVAVMTRRGAQFIDDFLASTPRLRARPIDDKTELEVANVLKSSEYFLASSPGEWLGLPALEAMAAGCAVLSPPTVGGAEFLHSGVNCVVGNPAQLARVINDRTISSDWWAEIVVRGMHTAQSLSLDSFRQKVAEAGRNGAWTW